MKIAIIGASYGQLPLCVKAREMGLETICFAWENGAICREYVDKFYPISVLEKERILEVCREEGVDGVVSNASDVLAEIVAFLSEKLGLIGNSFEKILFIKNKYIVRDLTSSIENLQSIRYCKYQGEEPSFYPCVVKPFIGASKKGVYFVDNREEFIKAISYAKGISDDILIEEYIDGREISVETISFNGVHYIVQVTDKENSGAPHFVELGHHQPAILSIELRDKVCRVVSLILDKVDFKNGAAHIEMKIDSKENLYLIEINPRGGGDEISSQLVYLSTGYDYVRSIINVAVGKFDVPQIENLNYSGIYYLCNQTKDRVEFFRKSDNKPWLIQKEVKSYELDIATGNYNRNGFIIYKSNRKIDCTID